MNFRIAPTIFQELLAPKTDYRVTVVGKEHFACKIESTDGTKVPTDWRTKKDGITFLPCSLPSEVSKKCIDLVSRFGLIFGAIDLAQVGDKFFFFELNPNGEWGWLQKTFPIAEALTERLIHGVEFES